MVTPGARGDSALFILFGYASENKQGWLRGYVNTYLNTGTYRGGGTQHQRDSDLTCDIASDNVVYDFLLKK